MKRHRHLPVGIKIERRLWLDAELAYHDECHGLALLFDPTVVPRWIDLPLYALVEPLKAQGWATLTVALIPATEAAHSEERSFQIAELTERCHKTLEWIDHQPFLAPITDLLVAVGWGTAAAAAMRLIDHAPARFRALSAPFGRLDLAGASVLRQWDLPIQLVTAANSNLNQPNQSAWALIPSPHKVWMEIETDTDSEMVSPEVADRVVTLVSEWLGGIIPAHDS
ncbi:MAG: hypothetical protein ACK4JZ_00530 [Hydrogenophilus thermoluteolus]